MAKAPTKKVPPAPKAKPSKVAKEPAADRQARHAATHKAIERAAKQAAPPPPAPAKRAKATQAPEPAPTPVAAPPAAPEKRKSSVPIGVYMNNYRNSAIVVNHTSTGLWYLTMITGEITLVHCSDDKFLYEWRIPMPAYPLRRAIKHYQEAYQVRDEKCAKVMHVMLRDL